jgi:hypothetical protein
LNRIIIITIKLKVYQLPETYVIEGTRSCCCDDGSEVLNAEKSRMSPAPVLDTTSRRPGPVVGISEAAATPTSSSGEDDGEAESEEIGRVYKLEGRGTGHG